MSLYAASALFAFMILVYWVISEVFTVLFRFTGLPDERARFQVMSLLTGCGFTTRESEMVLSSRSRRRLARITMLFGYVFNITIVSAFVNLFLSVKLVQAEHYFVAFLIPLAAVAAVLLTGRIRRVRAVCERVVEKLFSRIMKRDKANTVLLIDYLGRDSIAVVTLHTVPEAFAGKPLREIDLKSERRILVMLTEHGGAGAEPAGADTVFREGDKLTVFGEYRAICRAFNAKEQFADD